MNILFVLNSYPKIGGIEIVTRTISNQLQHKHQVFFLARFGHAHLGWDDKHVYYFKSKKKADCIAYYNELVDSLDVDIVIHQGPFLPFNDIIFNSERRENVRIFTFLHFLPGFEFQEVREMWRRERSLLKRAVKRTKSFLRLHSKQYWPQRTRRKYQRIYEESCQTVVLTNEYISEFKRVYNVSGHAKLRHITNPTRFEVRPVGQEVAKEKIVLFVGRLESVPKRVDRLLEIWKHVKGVESWKLYIVGEGEQEDFLKRKTELEQIPNVYFYGGKNNVDDFYKKASILALTSSYEGLPMCIIEAMQFGVVPIAFDVSPGIRELIVDNGVGETVEPFDMESYTEKLGMLMSDESLLRQLSDRSRRVSAKYRADEVVKQWEQLFRLA